MANIVRKRISPTILIGVGFSVILLLVLLAIGIDKPTSTIIGLAGGIITLLLDVITRIANMEERFIHAVGLSRTMTRDDELFSAVSSISEDYERVVRHGNRPLFTDRAKDLIFDCSNSLHRLAEGHMTLQPLSQFSFGAKGLPGVNKSIKSTSYIEAAHFWNSVAGKQYYQENLKLISTGVNITRIFIVDQGALAGIRNILAQQNGAGVNVLFAFIADIPPDLREDFLVADDNILVQLELARNGNARTERISIDQQEVRQAIARFDRLLKASYVYDELPP